MPRAVRKRVLALATAVLITSGSGAFAQDSEIVTDVLNACSDEIGKFCETVTPGNGRLLACFMAHEDKLSARCVNGLYDATDRLKGLINTMAFIGRSCKSELDTYCSDVEMGEGRISACLNANYERATPICRDALLGTGIRK